MEIYRIIISGDFLRVSSTRRFTQIENIKWLHNLLEPVFGYLAPDMPVSNIVGRRTPSGDNLAEKFYLACGMAPALQAWIRLLNGECNFRQKALVQEAFGHSLAITFELPDILAREFHALGIPFIDFAIHPVRFMRRLPFGIKSNIPNFPELIDKWKISETDILMECGMARAKLARLPNLPICDEYDGAALFACQTSEDKVLIQDGHLIEVEEVEDQLAKMCSDHPMVLVKPHPLQAGGKFEHFLLHCFGNTRKIENNIYHILNHEKITHVYSLSSSVSAEARYFRKQGAHMMGNVTNYNGSGSTENGYARIWPVFMDSGFWQGIFELLNIPFENKEKIAYDIDIRQSLGCWWGADLLYK